MGQSSRSEIQRNLQRAVRPVVQSLEPRQLLSVSLDQAGLLTITGTEGTDKIVVRAAKHKSQLRIGVNHEFTVVARQDVERIRIDARGGNDRIEIYQVGRKVAIRTEIYGGDGDDVIGGGAGADIIDGGAGNDRILGGRGKDKIRGGVGNDHISGGVGNDYVLGNDGDDEIVTVGKDRVRGGKGNNNVSKSLRPQFPISTYTGLPTGYTPGQIRNAYGFGDLEDPKYTNRGQGQAIVIIIAYHAPTAKADLAEFSRVYGLPKPDKKHFEQFWVGGRRPLVDEGWAGEAMLDIQWAHAIAPEAKIYLVEAQSDASADISQAINKSVDLLNRRHKGGVISMSLGSVEQQFDPIFEAVFTGPKTKNITFVAAAGDTGGVSSNPASSPHVVSVGGTTLFANEWGMRTPGFRTDFDPISGLPIEYEDDCGGNWMSAPAGPLPNSITPGGENPWVDGGGGDSPVFPVPQYQENIDIGPGRGTPDVAWNADPFTGVPVFNTTSFGGWAITGGTSAGAPQFAGLVALVNQLRAKSGKAKVGKSLLGRLYRLGNAGSGTYFNDIDQYGTGGDGCRVVINPATRGWDYATGFGTPKAQGLIPALAQDNSRPNFPFVRSQPLTFKGRASFFVPTDSTGGTGGGTGGTGGGIGSGGFEGFQTIPFTGRANATGFTTINLESIHMRSLFPITTGGSTGGGGGGGGGGSGGGSGGAQQTTLLVSLFGVDAESGASIPTIINPVTNRVQTRGTPIQLYRHGNTVTGMAIFAVSLEAIVRQGGFDVTNLFTGAVKFTGTINRAGKISGKFAAVYPWGTVDHPDNGWFGLGPTNSKGVELGGTVIKNIFNDDFRVILNGTF